MAEWQPIETAPKSGHFLGFSWKWGVSECLRFDNGTIGLATFNGNVMQAHPTHWMPMPDGPALPPKQPLD